ncbi:uncharacterized protein MICPUCDRAFT_15560, partial [Micromonas pusilla CCMP1545]
VTIAELARLLKCSPRRIETVLIDLGEPPASLEETVSADVIELCAVELGVDVEVVDDESPSATSADGTPLELPRRAVVAVMGHVDHGKTTLLDRLRSANVADGEAGGITQARSISYWSPYDRHLGAFVVKCGGGGELTFLDTPGHAAFSAMRRRGASVTDVAVLVCAADDGVMPQTREAAAHILAANCKFVVAITKCDRDGADPSRVRDELHAMGIALESHGGDVQCVEVSAMTGQGMEDLEMALFLEAESLNLTARRDCEGVGVILEARLDKGHGAVVTGLLRRGVVGIGEHVVAGTHYGRVRRLIGDGGVDVESCGPSEPFEITGLRGVPSAGDSVMVVATEERARRVATARADRIETARLAALSVGDDRQFIDDDADARAAESVNSDLCAIVKADVQGTAEAVRDSLLGLGTSSVGVKVVYVGVGAVSESDVALAAAIGGPILAFNVQVSNVVEKAAKDAGVVIVNRKVIYHLLDAVGELLGGLGAFSSRWFPYDREVLGEAEVRQVFDLSGRRGNKANMVAGCVVNSGSFSAVEKFRLLRDGEPVHEGLLDAQSIRRHRLEVTTVGKGTECGVSLADHADVKPGDVIQCVHFVKRKAVVEKVATGGARVVERQPR